MTETIVAIVVVILIACWCYKTGKREGSRKGYHVGRKRGRRRRHY